MKIVLIFIPVFCVFSSLNCSNSKPKKELTSSPVIELSIPETSEMPSLPTPEIHEEIEIKPIPVTEKYNFAKNGSLSVQVNSFQNPKRIESELELWKKRGFKNAYVAIFPVQNSDQVFYRVRLGKFKSKTKATFAAEEVTKEYNVTAWVDNTKSEIPAQ